MLVLVVNEIRSFSFKRNSKFSLIRDEEETKLPLFDVFVNDGSINLWNLYISLISSFYIWIVCRKEGGKVSFDKILNINCKVFFAIDWYKICITRSLMPCVK